MRVPFCRCVCYVIGACEGAPFDHVFRVPALSLVMSRVFIRRSRLCDVGDRCMLCGMCVCFRASNSVWRVSNGFISG